MGMCRSILSHLSSGLVLALLAGGCAGSRRDDGFAGIARDEWLQRPPPFMSGPAAVFLTNLDGFSAQATVRIQPAAAPARTISGPLLGRRGKLFFEPAPSKAEGKRADSRQFSFIWDAAAGSGYILSEDLQGYAPVASAGRFATPVTEPSASPTTWRTFEDHPVRAETATCAAGDGSRAVFQLLRARDLNGLALLVDSTNGPVPFTLTLSKVRMDPLAAELFNPPEGFTKYPSEQALLNELASREQSLQGQPQERRYRPEPDYPGKEYGSPNGPASTPDNRYGP
jgi:hypothetical protein